MIRMIKDWSVALLIAAAVFLFVGVFQGKPDLPDEAPLFSLTDLDGAPMALADHRGKIVVVNFWATWCGPCRAEIPEFAKFAEDYPDVVMLGLSVDTEPPAKVRKIADTFGITWPVAIADKALKAAYDVSVLPTTVVVDPDGGVRTAHVGQMSYDQLVRATR